MRYPTHYITTVIKIMSYYQRNRHIGQWSRIHNSEIELHKYAQLILDTGGKAFQLRKDNQWWSN